VAEAIAIISDMHANFEALRVVFQDIEDKGIKKILCLGDIVGYGPDPVACIDLARNFNLNLRGNHEEAVVNGAFGFNPIAKEAIDWTRNQLKPSWHSFAPKRARWEILKDLPLTHREGSFFFVHGSPRDPTMEYILKSDTEDLFGEIPSKIKEIFTMIPWVCFVGHTHSPGIITEESRFFSPVEFNGTFDIEDGRKYIVNVGSIGQPRDGDNRACYVILDGTLISYQRLEYDYVKTAKKIRSIAQLDDRNADRLQYGT
jgi:diadenosine tetraphosphatase ApaH/serine/threonine PP2A family protein phosphatase